MSGAVAAWLASAAALNTVNAVDAQTTVAVAVDPTKLVWGTAALLFSGLLTALGFIGRMLIKRLDTVAATSETTAKTTQVIHQELFGATGQNGLRSEVRRMSQQLNAHDDLLLLLARREGVDASRDARDAAHPRRTT